MSCLFTQVVWCRSGRKNDEKEELFHARKTVSTHKRRKNEGKKKADRKRLTKEDS